jgi:LPXTG-motif cell wall-anchored protein
MSVLGAVSHAEALTCASHPDDAAELVIGSGYPERGPYEHVVIATVLNIEPVNGDAGSFGQVLTVELDAVLRGDLPLSTPEIFNPSLGLAGWPWFNIGRQYLIPAHPNFDGDDGRVSTFLCAPIEEISSPDRFRELVSFSPNPVLPNTSVTPPSPLPAAGLVLLLIAAAVAARRRIGTDDHLHRRDHERAAPHAGGAAGAPGRPA